MGTTLKSPDRFRLELLDTILSGQSGRLFTELRDRQSLAYSLSSFSLFGLDTGAFGIYIGTSPDKMEQAIKGVWQELDTIRKEMVKEEELERAKNIVISQYELAMQTHSAQALEMGLNETYEMGQDFGNRYIKAINEVSKEEILAAAQKYILPEQYVMVAVGAGLAAGPGKVSESVTKESSQQKND
jgi:zinc protease